MPQTSTIDFPPPIICIHDFLCCPSWLFNKGNVLPTSHRLVVVPLQGRPRAVLASYCPLFHRQGTIFSCIRLRSLTAALRVNTSCILTYGSLGAYALHPSVIPGNLIPHGFCWSHAGRPCYVVSWAFLHTPSAWRCHQLHRFPWRCHRPCWIFTWPMVPVILRDVFWLCDDSPGYIRRRRSPVDRPPFFVCLHARLFGQCSRRGSFVNDLGITGSSGRGD